VVFTQKISKNQVVPLIENDDDDDDDQQIRENEEMNKISQEPEDSFRNFEDSTDSLNKTSTIKTDELHEPDSFTLEHRSNSNLEKQLEKIETKEMRPLSVEKPKSREKTSGEDFENSTDSLNKTRIKKTDEPDSFKVKSLSNSNIELNQEKIETKEMRPLSVEKPKSRENTSSEDFEDSMASLNKTETKKTDELYEPESFKIEDRGNSRLEKQQEKIKTNEMRPISVEKPKIGEITSREVRFRNESKLTREQILNHLDSSKLGKLHFKMLLATGIGFFAVF
jgi:hypothetical protein